MGVYFLLQRKDFLSGLFFVLATPKPHSWYLIAALTALIIISERRWRIIAGGLVGLFPLFLCCFLFNPEIFSRWVSLENNPLTWASVSGITPIRVWLSSFGLPNKWPLFVIPVVSTAIVLFIYIYRRSLWTVEESLVALVTLSMLTAPFGWGFDQMLLLCSFIFSIAHGIRERGGELSVSVSCAVAPILGLLYLAFLPYFEAYWFFLYAPALYISWWFTKRLRERSLHKNGMRLK